MKNLMSVFVSQARRVWLAGILGVVMLAQWSGVQARQAEIEDIDWLKPEPLAQRVDVDRLAALTQHLKAEHPAVRSLLMVRNGRPVFEYHGSDSPAQSLYNVHSVTKSVVALLVGRAIDQGLIRGTQEKLADFFPAQPGAVGDIRLEHLLTMSAGFDPGDTSRQADYLDFESRFFSPGLLAHALARPVRAPPGERFHYNNLDAHLLSLALAARVGVPVAAYADAQLFKPMGITQFAWTADASGTNNGASELRLRARDMAKIGQLVLQRGQWRGQQLVSSAFIDAATQRRIETSVVSGDAPRPWGYGYLWWTSSTRDDQLIDHFAAGFGGQYIHVVPALNLVVVATTQASSRAMAARTTAVIRNFAVPAVLR